MLLVSSMKIIMEQISQVLIKIQMKEPWPREAILHVTGKYIQINLQMQYFL